MSVASRPVERKFPMKQEKKKKKKDKKKENLE